MTDSKLCTGQHKPHTQGLAQENGCSFPTIKNIHPGDLQPSTLSDLTTTQNSKVGEKTNVHPYTRTLTDQLKLQDQTGYDTDVGTTEV